MTNKIYEIGQSFSGLIGQVKAGSKKEALKKAIGLPMYDFRQKTKAWLK